MTAGPDCASVGSRWRAPSAGLIMPVLVVGRLHPASHRRTLDMDGSVDRGASPKPTRCREAASTCGIVDLNVENVRDVAPRNDLRRTIQNETAR
jgi:hypothetical protein